MRRYVYKLVFIFNFILSSFNVASAAEDATTLQTKYLYKLTSGHSSVLYLYGSSHVSTSNMSMRLGQCVKNVFKKIDHAYLEADLSAIMFLPPASKSTVSMRLVGEFLDESNKNILIEKIFGNKADGIEQLFNLDAQIIFNMLMSNIPGSLTLFGLPDYGPDVELTLAARFLNKKLDYIETPEDQLVFFRKVPPEIYATAITAVLKLFQNESEATLYLNKALSLYRAAADGDEDGIVSGLKFDGLEELYKRTIMDRNESITEKIVSRLSANKDKAAFIAIGAAHLAGEGSVVQRLKAKGYTATRLCQ